MIYFCCDELRRAALADPSKNPSGLNGIDFLEVLDHELPPNQKIMRQRLLELHFVNPGIAERRVDDADGSASGTAVNR